MGEAAAAVRAAALIQELDPECLAMCGICAGWRGKVFLGDVIVADRVFSYDFGKQVSGGDERGDSFFHDITTYNLEATWRMDASYFAQEFQKTPRLLRQRPLSKEAQARWLLYTLEAYERQAGPSPIDHPERKARCQDWRECIQALRKRGVIAGTPGELKLTEAGRIAVAEERLQDPDENESDPTFRVHVAPIATGSAVREDPGLFDRLSRHVRKVRGAEMEARAIGFVAEQLGRRRSIIVKAVSDYADEDKDDAVRPFACHASAAFLMAFLQKHLRVWSAQPSHRPPVMTSAFRSSPRKMGEEEKLHEEFLAHVERACVLRHPQGTKITRRQAPPPFRTFLEVAEPEGRFVRVFPVAAVDRPWPRRYSKPSWMAFMPTTSGGIRRCARRWSTPGMSASEELEGKAHARHVRLTSFGEYQGLIDFSAYLQRQTARLEADPIYPPSLYVEQRARVSIGGQEATSTSDVLATLREMLDSPHPRFALVLGDFGTGKTFLLHELARRMATEQAALVPVLIEMRALEKRARSRRSSRSTSPLADVGRFEPDRSATCSGGRIALLFDGFDELALRVTYDQAVEHFDTLSRRRRDKREGRRHEPDAALPDGPGGEARAGEQAARLPGYRLIKLEPFNKEQVRSFLAKRLGSEAAADERLALLRDVQDLLGLSENPRMLSFIAELDAEIAPDRAGGNRGRSPRRGSMSC